MRDAVTRLEITPRTIDLGDRVIQLSAVASLRVGVVRPLRRLAAWPFVIAILLIGYEVLGQRSVVSSQTITAPSGIIVLALVLVVIAAGCFFYRIQRLVISTADSQTILIRSSDPTFLRLVLENIRLAMERHDPGLLISIDLVARTIDSGSPSDAKGSVRSAKPRAGTGSTDWAERGPQPELPHHAANGAAATASPTPSLDTGKTAEPRSSFAEAMLRQAKTSEAPASSRTTAEPRPRGETEVADVIALIDRARLPHTSELHALLNPVRDHLSGGGTRRGDALHNWRLFHDYAEKYLTDVEGLGESCRRVSAVLG
jgi:hypothetical protein